MSGLVQQPDKIVVRSAHTIYPYSLDAETPLSQIVRRAFFLQQAESVTAKSHII
jgi:hypothetical protein